MTEAAKLDSGRGATVHLGSGLSVGRARDEEPTLRIRREGPRCYRAAIQGIKDETVVCTWEAAETYRSATEALEAARAFLAKQAG